jgi:hypothetical protein
MDGTRGASGLVPSGDGTVEPVCRIVHRTLPCGRVVIAAVGGLSQT